MEEMHETTEEAYQDIAEEFNTKKMSSKNAFAHGYGTGANIALKKLWEKLPVTIRMELNQKHGFVEVYNKHEGNLTETAKELGIKRIEAYHRAERYNLLNQDTSIPVPYAWGSNE